MALDFKTAIKYYELVAQTDATCATAIFGLARCQMHVGSKQGTIAAYQRISPNSNLHAQSQMAIIRTLLNNKTDQPGIDDLKQAAAALKTLKPDGLQYHQLAADVLQMAVERLLSQGFKEDGGTILLDKKLYLTEMRRGAEEELRACAKFAGDEVQRNVFVDEANAVRPVTLL